MNTLRHTVSVLSLLTWLLPGVMAHGLALHISSEHSPHIRSGPVAPDSHAPAAHSHHSDGDEHHRDHHEQITALLAQRSTAASRTNMAAAMIVLTEPIRFAPAFTFSTRSPEPDSRARPANIPRLHPILLI
ncbi:MAG: hypothetical protein ABIS67_11380 [Candidatus Eisenbacteria bacterium]